mmetsp:Transcript_33990/g.79502  ORF Transcript_33990/g.79502 Transcript_33990/m.79502 type:complete len:1210 (-) Transcript_33990:177-3806(-)
MFIEELIIDGFKSYSTRTTVGFFDRQFNAITGLNGSGKSNILDSICFVLGISNLSQVRAANLMELVYKQGQAGVTKATVTVIFNNEDKSCSPVGYEMHDKITITRQIVIGGKNRYLLNSHTVQANQIQNLFHSVSLNVNNPHFLIMQGRITKVINMKPQETLGMIEEAAGTRMYENKKSSALKTLEKKQNKVDEISRLLSEEITPTLEKLQKERQNYMLWVSNNNEIERLQRFCTAYEYIQVQNRLSTKNQQLEGLEEAMSKLVVDLQEMAEREKAIHAETKKKAKARDSQSAQTLKALEEGVSKANKDVASMESKLKNREKELHSHREGQKKSQGQLQDLRKLVEEKQGAWQKEKDEFDKLAAAEGEVQQKIEQLQWSMQALNAGVSTETASKNEGESKSMREELLAAQTRLQEMDAVHAKKGMAVTHIENALKGAEEKVAKSQQDGKRLLKEKGTVEAALNKKRAEMAQLDFDPQRQASLEQSMRQGQYDLRSLQERVNAMRGSLGGIDFQFQDPYRNFDRSKVKGVVAKLFTIQSDYSEYSRALEVSAGGRLFFVVVDNEETGKALLEKGQLRRRVTIIPLTKIADSTLRPDIVRQAQSVKPQGSEVHTALQIIGFNKDVQNAMKFVFGGSLVCDTSATAKQVTFHPNVRVRSVTKDGDVYDPQGTITGGSAPQGGDVLQKLQELNRCEEEVRTKTQELKLIQDQLGKMSSGASTYRSLDQEVKCKEHELQLMNERIRNSEHHVAEQTLNDMRAQVAQLKEEIKNLPEEKKRLEKECKDLEKEIKSLDSNRGDRLKHLQGQVEKFQAEAKKHQATLEKQQEKMDQASVDYEVMCSELKAQESKDEASGQSNDSLATEIETLKQNLAGKKEEVESLTAKLEEHRAFIASLDATLGSLSQELATIAQQREEKELEQKRITHKIQQVQKDDKEVHVVVARLEKENPWLEKEKHLFGKKGTDFDFQANNPDEAKGRLNDMESQQKKLSKNINKKAMAMFDKAEQEYKDLLEKRDIILNDKKKIEEVIVDLDHKKTETLRRTWQKVNKDFDSIFSTLLPHTNAKLEPPQGMSEVEGLEIKVAFNGVWKQSLSELSGGQRSLLALSLVLALLLFKPAPMYILDEIDSALDLSHTQNIGHMIRTHFPHSQFIVVSLKEGMFNNANVLFRTRFVDGTSTVARYSIRDSAAEEEREKDRVSRKRKMSSSVAGAGA